MKVKIIKSSEPTYWYSKCIGRIFEVAVYSSTDYIVTYPKQVWNQWILKKDCRPQKRLKVAKRATNKQSKSITLLKESLEALRAAGIERKLRVRIGRYIKA